MKAPIDERLLDEKLASLEKARSWQPRLVSKLESVIRSDDEEDLFRLNPLRFSSEKGVGEQEAIDLFLHSVKAGLFRLNWQLWCPGCGGIVESFDSLRRLGPHYHCNLCQVSLEATLDDFIEITFALSPQIRDLKYYHLESLTPEEYFLGYVFHPRAYAPDGTNFATMIGELKPPMFYLEPGGEASFDMTLARGVLAGADWLNRVDFLFTVTGEPEASVEIIETVFDDRGSHASTTALRPGTKSFRFKNTTSLRRALIFLPHAEGEAGGPMAFPPFLSGKRIFNSQTFRDLFHSETVGAEEGIAIREITVLFTDLKGSTALYDRIGDLKAYHLVRQHFGSLAQVINRHGGAIVKTIGDAVMATFLEPAAALESALGMLEEIDRFNQSNGGRDVILKIGIHRGSSIAVTLNDRLDYFGQTVNIASRVQGLAGAEEIFITQEMFDAPNVRALMKGCDVRSREARLRGIQEKVKVYRLKTKRPAIPSQA